jgi:hypothetical protein
LCAVIVRAHAEQDNQAVVDLAALLAAFLVPPAHARTAHTLDDQPHAMCPPPKPPTL